MKKLYVGGELHEILEDMGYQPSIGHYALRIRWGIGLRVAVAKAPSGPWRFWTTRDVVQVNRRRLSNLGSGR